MEENNKNCNKGVFHVEIKQKNEHIRRRTVKTWTADEDEQLLFYYKMHPKKWPTIAAKMTDRN